MKIKRRTLLRGISWAIRLVVVGCVSFLFYCYFGTQFFTITSYQISGVDESTRVLLDKQLHELDDKKLYKILPADKIFTYSAKNITSTVRGIVPEMAAITARPVGLHTIKIEITLLKPVFRISDTQAITSDGVIFTTKYDIRAYPRLIIASSTTKLVKNNGLVFSQLSIPDEESNSAFLVPLHDIVQKINSVIFHVESVSVEATGEVLCINKEGTGKVIFIKDADYKKIWSTLVSAVDTEPLKSKIQSSKSDLEYLDVRYGNKVFYRFSDMAFQNGSVNGILGNHATTTQKLPEASSSTER